MAYSFEKKLQVFALKNAFEKIGKAKVSNKNGNFQLTLRSRSSWSKKLKLHFKNHDLFEYVKFEAIS